MADNKGCCYRIRRCCSCMVSLAILGVLAVVLWHFLGRPSVDDAREAIGKFDFDDFTNVLGNLTDRDWVNIGFDEDPYVGDNTTNAWATNGQDGLVLELQNALSDNWETEFEESVADWQQSDVLSLSTKRVAVDHSCGRVEGVMLVCNGNFGNTGWVGINEVEITSKSRDSPGFITSSVAKMNEYYLNNANYAKRLYTMCHEIGHGFGLPHTDENPNNRDLGNCLDYTSNPENNLRPGEANFARLREIYLESAKGNGGGSTGNGGTTATQLQNNNKNRNLQIVEMEEGQEEDRPGKEGKYLRRVVVRHYLYVEDFKEWN